LRERAYRSLSRSGRYPVRHASSRYFLASTRTTGRLSRKSVSFFNRLTIFCNATRELGGRAIFRNFHSLYKHVMLFIQSAAGTVKRVEFTFRFFTYACFVILLFYVYKYIFLYACKILFVLFFIRHRSVTFCDSCLKLFNTIIVSRVKVYRKKFAKMKPNWPYILLL